MTMDMGTYKVEPLFAEPIFRAGIGHAITDEQVSFIKSLKMVPNQTNLISENLYIFDEPEAALSPQRQLTLLINIYRCAQEGAQFIIVSHSPILLGMPDAEIFSFDNGTIHPCQYEDTDSYVITKTFVTNRQHFLNQLLNEET